MDTIASTVAEMLIQHGIPWLGKKAVEMGRYYGSEALRNPKLQKKALDYALEKVTPFIKKTGSEMLDQLSTKVRPNKKYVTDRKDLDGSGFDLQKQLSKLGELHMRTPTGKKYNYCGPGTKLEERLASDDPKYREPINKLDAICQQHDIDYSNAQSSSDKHAADDIMLQRISEIPYRERPWGTSLAQAAIATKKKLGLGASKNAKSRRVTVKTGRKH